MCLNPDKDRCHSRDGLFAGKRRRCLLYDALVTKQGGRLDSAHLLRHCTQFATLVPSKFWAPG